MYKQTRANKKHTFLRKTVFKRARLGVKITARGIRMVSLWSLGSKTSVWMKGIPQMLLLMQKYSEENDLMKAVT